jgi:hypothetical protein
VSDDDLRRIKDEFSESAPFDFDALMVKIDNMGEATRARLRARTDMTEAAYASLRRGMTALDMAHVELSDAVAAGLGDALPYLQALDKLLGEDVPGDPGRAVLVLCAQDEDAGYFVDIRENVNAPWAFLAGHDMTPLLRAVERMRP